MSLYEPRNRLQQGWQFLTAQWNRTATTWNDPARWQFEGEVWKPLQSQVPMTLMAMERLGQVLAQAQQEVH